MMGYTIIAAAVFGLFAILFDSISSVEGLKCYECSSAKNPEICGGDFKGKSANSSIMVDNCEYCQKYHFKDDNVYIRNCTKKSSSGVSFKFGCEDVTSGGKKVEVCYCNGELCNNANRFLVGKFSTSICIFLILSVLSGWNM